MEISWEWFKHWNRFSRKAGTSVLGSVQNLAVKGSKQLDLTLSNLVQLMAGGVWNWSPTKAFLWFQINLTWSRDWTRWLPSLLSNLSSPDLYDSVPYILFLSLCLRAAVGIAQFPSSELLGSFCLSKRKPVIERHFLCTTWLDNTDKNSQVLRNSHGDVSGHMTATNFFLFLAVSFCKDIYKEFQLCS